jgi:hypothetical protein
LVVLIALQPEQIFIQALCDPEMTSGDPAIEILGVFGSIPGWDWQHHVIQAASPAGSWPFPLDAGSF